MDAGSAKKSARMLALLRLVEERQEVSVMDLAAELDASAATIRRDLAALADQGLVTRKYGAVGRVGTENELPVRLRDVHNRDAKHAIAQAVVAMLPMGKHVVALTGGTTTTEVMRALPLRPDLTVITNSIALGIEAADVGLPRVLVAGGRLRANSMELVGSLTEATFNQITVGTAIVGCDGISLQGGLTTHDEVEAHTNHTMIARAHTVLAVADGSKVGRCFAAKLADLSEVAHLVTDASADPVELRRIRDAGVQVTVVPRSQ